MQISQHLPTFDVTTLILVTGGQTADLYVAENKTIEKPAEIEIENPTYSDDEGQFQRGGKGKNFGSGSVKEENEELVKKDFYHKLNDQLKKITNKKQIDTVYFLSPSQDKNETKEKLPTSLQDKISLEIDGNFVGDHPTDILERIDENLA
jgi:hypothetical protein